MSNVWNYITFENPHPEEEQWFSNSSHYKPFENETLRHQIEAALEELYSIPEGRELIEEAAAQNPNGKIFIGSGSIRPPIYYMANFKDKDPNTIHGSIHVDPSRRHDIEFGGLDGQPHDVSLHRGLVHELIHIKNGDPRDLAIALLNSEPPELNELQREHRVIEETNKFMAKHYGEAYRGHYTSTRAGRGTPEFDIAQRIDPSQPPETPTQPLGLAEQILHDAEVLITDRESGPYIGDVSPNKIDTPKV